MSEGYDFEAVRGEIEGLREKVNRLRRTLSSFFVDKGEIIDLMCVCTLAQEPLLLVGRPGTAKSDIVVKFAQALGLEDDEYFEYMLTKFTEPSEIVGPIDISELKQGRYLRRVQGKLPEARLVFLDEIFKSNSAILNTLLTIINERKFYQDGKPKKVKMQMLFGATNEVPEFTELDALKDRFVLKCESRSVRGNAFDELVEKGLRNDLYKSFNQKPWAGVCDLEDFIKLKYYLDQTTLNALESDDPDKERKRYFPDAVFTMFKRILRTLEREDRIEVTDRKVIKLYKLLRARAFLFHGGVVTKDDLVLLRYLGNRNEDFAVVRDKVDKLLHIESSSSS